MSTEVTRRELLAAAGAMGATLLISGGCATRSTKPWIERRDLYPQGVASGDPTHDSVILWTRRPPSAEFTAQTLEVQVATDARFTHVVAAGHGTLSGALDWTCRILVAGLEPRRQYWYRFRDERGFTSRTGRTVTAPAEDDTRPVRFTFVSCQDVTQGACNAWRRMLFEDQQRSPDEQLGFVLHLGDFIYEVVWYPEDRPQGMYGRRLRDLIRYPQGEKLQDFHIPVTLEDYRTAYRAYLQDPDLQDARAHWPFVPVWDNHEFSWQGFQSQQVFDGAVRPAQTRKVAATQAWFEFQPARVRQPAGMVLDRFDAPKVADTPLGATDALGFGLEPNNLAAVQALSVQRTLRWGRNVELIITDNHSFRSKPPDPQGPAGFTWMVPQDAMEALDAGQSVLGVKQKAWLLERLKQSTATWKLWGHSSGTLEWRTDVQNLPPALRTGWPGDSYASFNGGYYQERGEIFDFVRDQGITGFAVIAGDKHSFWAGLLSKELPPRRFEPVGVEFVTGSISAPGLFEVAEYRMAKDAPLRALFLHDRRDGTVAPAMNVTMMHGVRAALALAEGRAIEHRNPDVAPHIAFADLGGHGYCGVRVSSDRLETEFVCIPRPLERSGQSDGGPLLYRVVHRVDLWARGQHPSIVRERVEGTPPFGN